MGESKRRQHFYGNAPENRLGDAPIEAQYYDQMVAVAQGLNEFFNGEAKGDDRKVGFVLMVFPFGDHEGRCNYISNGADRKDIVILMSEMIARFRGQPEQKGSA
jgi:citrate lyase alpha subunit